MQLRLPCKAWRKLLETWSAGYGGTPIPFHCGIGVNRRASEYQSRPISHDGEGARNDLYLQVVVISQVTRQQTEHPNGVLGSGNAPGIRKRNSGDESPNPVYLIIRSGIHPNSCLQPGWWRPTEAFGQDHRPKVHRLDHGIWPVHLTWIWQPFLYR